MKKLSLLLVLMGSMCFAQAQIANDKYWVQFTDKNNSPYSIDNPEAFLSQRALQRRANQGIAIDEYDIPVNPQYLQAVADCGAELINPSKWLNGVTICTSDPAVIESINALEFVDNIRCCEYNAEAQLIKERWLAKEMEMTETNVQTRGYYGGAYTQIDQLNGIALHDSGFTGKDMVIAVLDGGFVGADTHHCFDRMREEGRLLGTRDFVYHSNNVYTQSSHGCSCLSTIGGYDPQSFVGTAPKASFYLIHTEDGNSENIIEEYNWVSGAEYADSLGVDVCSTSLGYIDFDMSQWDHPFEHYDGHTAPMTIGAEIAASRGMICVNSAGNEGDSWNGECTLGIPGDAEHILTIGAVDERGVRAGFSSVGPTYDGRIKPDVMAMGYNTYVANANGGYSNGSGTSFSCPVMAGMVTCLWQAFPNATAAEIRDAVRECSDRAQNPDTIHYQYGYGIPDFQKALDVLPVQEVVKTDEIIAVYPNPTRGEVHVRLLEGVEANVGVFDYMGRQLFAYHFNGLNHTTLENGLNELPTGVYFISVNSESGSQTLKLVITK